MGSSSSALAAFSNRFPFILDRTYDASDGRMNPVIAPSSAAIAWFIGRVAFLFAVNYTPAGRWSTLLSQLSTLCARPAPHSEIGQTDLPLTCHAQTTDVPRWAARGYRYQVLNGQSRAIAGARARILANPSGSTRTSTPDAWMALAAAPAAPAAADHVGLIVGDSRPEWRHVLQPVSPPERDGRRHARLFRGNRPHRPARP